MDSTCNLCQTHGLLNGNLQDASRMGLLSLRFQNHRDKINLKLIFQIFRKKN